MMIIANFDSQFASHRYHQQIIGKTLVRDLFQVLFLILYHIYNFIEKRFLIIFI
jgi:hypothetical protein